MAHQLDMTTPLLYNHAAGTLCTLTIVCAHYCCRGARGGGHYSLVFDCGQPSTQTVTNTLCVWHRHQHKELAVLAGKAIAIIIGD
jgi:hypothetical protein